jgi:hypothetical protein
MSTVSTVQNESLALAEYICTHYNTQLKCPSCNTIHRQGAFNRDQTKKGSSGKPIRRFVCKGKSSGKCSKSLSPTALWILARSQLDGEAMANLQQRFPTITQTVEAETTVQKRPHDFASTGLTPQGKRTFLGIDCSDPPPNFATNEMEFSCPGTSDSYDGLFSDPVLNPSQALELPESSPSIPSSQNIDCLPDDLNYLRRLLKEVKAKIEQLELLEPLYTTN